MMLEYAKPVVERIGDYLFGFWSVQPGSKAVVVPIGRCTEASELFRGLLPLSKAMVFLSLTGRGPSESGVEVNCGPISIPQMRAR